MTLPGAPPANAEPQAFRVEFSSSTSCRDPNEFTRWLRAFTPRVRPARPGEPALTFVVLLVPTEAGVGGRLIFREIDARETLREVPSPNCHDVIQGMALIAALTVDPLASISPELMRGAASPPVDPEPAPARVERRPAAPDEPTRFHLAVGARAETHGALAPDLAWGGAISASAAYTVSDHVEPRLRLSGHFAQSSSSGFEGGSAEFTWLTARLSVCPVRWSAGDAVHVRPCAFGDAGQLRVVGTGADEPDPEPEPQTIFWSAAGAAVELEAELAGPLIVGAEGGVFTPFRRDLFFFGGSEAVHRIPAVGVTASVGLGLRFF